MKLGYQLILLVAFVALAAVAITAGLSYGVTSQRVQHYFQTEDAENLASESEQGQRGRYGLAFNRSAARLNLLDDLAAANLRSAVIALFVALLAGAFFTYRLSHPIAELTKTSKRYAAGERSLRVELKGNNELTDLARVFNATADQLEQEQTQQQRLIADIAHELRTPLTILKSELEAMQDGLMEANSDNIEELKEQVDLLGRLVQDLRFLTIAEAGELELTTGELNLDQVLLETVLAFNAQAQAKKVRLETALEPVRLEADKDRLKQALFNLLGNALRYSPEGSSIHLELKRDKRHAFISLSDEGQGISPEHLPHIFDRFYRADAARNREQGGSGLGLAIVKAIISLHGGRVWAENQAEGGARFWLELPLTS
ncbi:MAG: HAMP domain-containing protein [Trueperaceae bacterium]|nr:HAMP domain-containing protein [Trueperaceae bacterium]